MSGLRPRREAPLGGRRLAVLAVVLSIGFGSALLAYKVV